MSWFQQFFTLDTLKGIAISAITAALIASPKLVNSIVSRIQDSGAGKYKLGGLWISKTTRVYDGEVRTAYEMMRMKRRGKKISLRLYHLVGQELFCFHGRGYYHNECLSFAYAQHSSYTLQSPHKKSRAGEKQIGTFNFKLISRSTEITHFEGVYIEPGHLQNYCQTDKWERIPYKLLPSPFERKENLRFNFSTKKYKALWMSSEYFKNVCDKCLDTPLQ